MKINKEEMILEGIKLTGFHKIANIISSETTQSQKLATTVYEVYEQNLIKKQNDTKWGGKLKEFIGTTFNYKKTQVNILLNGGRLLSDEAYEDTNFMTVLKEYKYSIIGEVGSTLYKRKTEKERLDWIEKVEQLHLMDGLSARGIRELKRVKPKVEKSEVERVHTTLEGLTKKYDKDIVLKELEMMLKKLKGGK